MRVSTWRFSLCLGLAAIAFAPAQATTGRGPQAAATRADPNARAWTGRVAEIEAYLRTAPIARREQTKNGVT